MKDGMMGNMVENNKPSILWRIVEGTASIVLKKIFRISFSESQWEGLMQFVKFEFYFGVLIVPLALPLLQKNTDIKYALSWPTFVINTIIVAIVISQIYRSVYSYIKTKK